MSNSPKGRCWRRVARYFAYLVVAFFVAAVTAIFFLPELLDSPAVRSQIQRKLSQAVGGEVTWEQLELRLRPAPNGVLRKPLIDIPGVAHVHAEQIEARLLFWPLLRGHVEITDISVASPAIRVEAALLAKERNAAEDAAGDPFVVYRKVMQPIVNAVRRVAPDAVLTVENGAVDIRVAEMPPIELRDLSLRLKTGSRGMDIETAMTGNAWEQMRLSARIDYSDFSGKASLDIDNVQPQPWLDFFFEKLPVHTLLPAANLKIRLNTDAKTALNSDFELSADEVGILHNKARVRVAELAIKGKIAANPQEIVLDLNTVKLDAGSLNEAKLRYDIKAVALSGNAGFSLDLKQGLDYARPFARGRVVAALARVKQVSGHMHGRVQLMAGNSGWHIGADVRKSDASVRLQNLADPVRIASGTVDINAHAVKAERVSLSVPAGQALAAVQYSIHDRSFTGGGSFDVDVAQTLRMILGVLPAKSREALAVVQTTSGRAKGNAKFSVDRRTWHANVDVQNSNAVFDIRNLPGPVRLAGGFVAIDPQIIRIDRAALSMPGARGSVSATISDYPADRRQLTGSVSEGLVDEELLAWIWKVAQIPQHLAVKAPISIAAKRIAWSPRKMLDVSASVRFGAGPEVTVDGGWTPGVFDIRRATIRDDRSNAAIALRTRDRLLEGSFSGVLHSSSIAAMLKDAQPLTGNAAGDLHFVFDRENPRRTTVKGSVKGESLDLTWLLGRSLKITSFDLQSDNRTLDIRGADVEWLDQRVKAHGRVSRGAKGPVIDLQLDSPGIDLDKLLPAKGKLPAARRHTQKPGAGSEASKLWPLPVTGRIAIRSDSVRHGHYTIAPLAASAVLEEHRVRLDLAQGKMCGLALPLTIEASPQGFTASAQITAQSQQLDQTVRCLTDSRIAIDGVFDLKADISTRGRLAELKQNLQGTVSGEMRDGRVMKFALLGNILSLGNVAALFEKGVPKLDDAGFPYRALTVNGQFGNGRFMVEEGAFRSDAVGLVARGWVSLDYQSRLSVLVAPFSRLDEIVRKVPVLGYIVGGSLTSVPVGVSGDIRNPVVVPLGPKAVTSELMGIFERTLKLPGKLVAPFKDDHETEPSSNKP